MKIGKLKLAAALVLALAIIAGGFGALAWSAAAIADQNTSKYRATLKSGATIEVVGVSTYPTGPGTWWAPDGTPIEGQPVDPIKARTSPNARQVVRVILARVSGVDRNDTFRWLPTHDGTYDGGRPTKDGKPAPGLEFYVAAFQDDRAYCAVDAKIASGPWRTEASDSGRYAVSFSKGGHKYYFGKARAFNIRYGQVPMPGTTIAVAHDLADTNNRLVAIDRDGDIHDAVFSTNGSGETVNLLDTEFSVPPEQIREYQVQSRAFERAAVDKIALRPRGGTVTRPAPPSGPHADPAPAQPVATRRPVATPAPSAPDSDGDGLSDDQEIHKYFTDPKKFSTAGDSVSDGDWQRRREFTYTIRSVVKIMPPVNLDCLNDDYQDARVVSESPEQVGLEVVHYPLNTNAKAIVGNPKWRKDARALAEFVQPGITTNWDTAMQRELVAALKNDGIDPDQLDDKALVQKVAQWLLANSKYRPMFCTHYIHYPEGRAEIFPGLESKFESDKGEASWTNQEQLEHELFGRTMFATRTHGSCTSTAVFLTTVLRALGLPTRMVLAIPVIDANDPAQLALIRSNVANHQVRRTLLLALEGARGYANHTFNEVYVGGRWARLNDKTLGQNTLDVNCMGLLTHVNTFNDLSDVPLAATWGKRYARGERDETFRYSNPYKTEELSDHFGRFARIENAKAREHRAITLSRIYWADSPAAPHDSIRTWGRRAHDGSGHAVVHGDEWFDEESYVQYKVFMAAADKRFTLHAPGQPDVEARITMSFFTDPSARLRELELLIPPAEFARMRPGVDYTPTPRNSVEGYTWSVTKGLTVRKP